MLNEGIVDLSEDIRWEFGGYKVVKCRGLFIGSYKVNVAPCEPHILLMFKLLFILVFT